MLYNNMPKFLAISDSSLFTGGIKLAQDLTTWITGAAAVFGILMIGYCFLRKIGAEQDKVRAWNDRIKMIGGAVIGIIVAKGVIELAISYFQ